MQRCRVCGIAFNSHCCPGCKNLLSPRFTEKSHKISWLVRMKYLKMNWPGNSFPAGSFLSAGKHCRSSKGRKGISGLTSAEVCMLQYWPVRQDVCPLMFYLSDCFERNSTVLLIEFQACSIGRNWHLVLKAGIKAIAGEVIGIGKKPVVTIYLKVIFIFT